MGEAKLRVGITGAGGMVGTALTRSLTEDGHEVVRFVRREAREGQRRWDPSASAPSPGLCDDLDAVVHLAGEGIASGRWTDALRARIRDSRVDGTRVIAEACAAAERGPRVLVQASGVGYYGDTRTPATEGTAPGEGFLADVTQAWEAASSPAEEAGIRVAKLRLGVVLAEEGGALAKMRLPFKMGVGGRIGDGTQPFPWVSLVDVVGAFRLAIESDALRGPVNVAGPERVDNATFSDAFAAALRRPSFFPLPSFAAKTVFGSEMAEQLFLTGAWAVPEKLEQAGYRFVHATLEDALRHTEG